MVRKVFFSFHYGKDVFRVQQVIQIGTLEGNKPVSIDDWEKIKKNDDSVKNWVDETMKNCECVIVLIGSETANRPWVDYEIRKAWNSGKGLFGIYIHNLKDPRTGKCNKGENPFDKIPFTDGTKLSTKVKCYEPDSEDAYNSIKNGIEKCVEIAIKDRKINTN